MKKEKTQPIEPEVIISEPEEPKVDRVFAPEVREEPGVVKEPEKVEEPYTIADFRKDFEKLGLELTNLELLKAQMRDKQESSKKRYEDALVIFNKFEFKKIDN